MTVGHHRSRVPAVSAVVVGIPLTSGRRLTPVDPPALPPTPEGV
jgi:hypothetical protein